MRQVYGRWSRQWFRYGSSLSVPYGEFDSDGGAGKVEAGEGDEGGLVVGEQ